MSTNDETSYDDEEMRSCRQCGGNDGYLYSATPLKGWYCGSCYHGLEEDARDFRMEELDESKR